MIIKSYEIQNNKLDKHNIYLFYGKNKGLKQDLSRYSLKIKEKNSIQFKKFKFEEEEILKDQNNFYNLIFSGSLFDPQKAIFINHVSDKIYNLIEDIIQKDISETIIFLEAGLLDKKSKIRNLFEKEKNLVCIPCYEDNNLNLTKIINNELKKSNLKISNESINLLIQRASGDRENLRNEMQKLISFAKNKKTVLFDDIKKLTNLAENHQNDHIINICLNRENKILKKIIEDNIFSVEDFFILIKVLSRKIHRLIKIKSSIEKKLSIDDAMNQFRPPIFWKEKNEVKKQINLWNINELNNAVKKITQIELECKKNHEVSLKIMINFLAELSSGANNVS